MDTWQYIGKGIVGIGLFLGSLLGYHPVQNLGTTPYKPVPRFESSLALTLPAAQTSTMTVVTGVDGNNMTLTGPMCFTIDAGVAGKVEDVCGTASGTTISNLSRGVDSSGYTSSSTLAHDHRVGADVKTTDSPYLPQYYNFLNGTLPFPNPLVYESGVTNATLTANLQNLADVSYVNSVASSGAPNGSKIVKGIFQEATLAQLAAASGTGSTGADLVITPLFTASSSQATTSIIVTKANGTLDSSFISSGTTYTVGGLRSASTTLTGATTIGGVNVTSTSFSKFGGTGVDGALSLSGTQTSTVNVGTATVYIKNYTSISITQSSSLMFVGSSTNGTVVILKSQGNCTLTAASGTMIDVSQIGATTGNNGSGLTSGPGTGFGYFITFTQPGPTTEYAGYNIGGKGVHVAASSTSMYAAFAGAGGSSANGESIGASGVGGQGGGGLVIECGGALNFTGTINANGNNGTNGGSGSQVGYCAGPGGGSNTDGGISSSCGSSGTLVLGGGGGGAGSTIILYTSLTANSGTINITGGTGGTNAANGGTGFSFVGQNTEF